MADLKDFINQSKNGINTTVGEKGIALQVVNPKELE